MSCDPDPYMYRDLVCGFMKSSYNERFSFADPRALQSASRATRYRIKRRMRATMEEENSISVLCPAAEERACDDSDCSSNSVSRKND